MLVVYGQLLKGLALTKYHLNSILNGGPLGGARLTLSDNQFSDTVSCCDLDNLFNGFFREISSITTYHNGRSSDFIGTNCCENTLKIITRQRGFNLVIFNLETLLRNKFKLKKTNWKLVT